MATPTPAIPSFTDGTVVHQADLNALASNLTNLYNYNQAGFFTQKPCVIAVQTSGQSIPNTTDTMINFNSAPINTANMWVGSQANTITIQYAGIYLIIGTIPYPTLASGATQTMGETANIWVNGTSAGNAVVGADIPALNTGSGSGPTPVCCTLQNLAVGATVHLDAWQSSGGAQTLRTSPYGASFMAIYMSD